MGIGYCDFQPVTCISAGDPILPITNVAKISILTLEYIVTRQVVPKLSIQDPCRSHSSPESRVQEEYPDVSPCILAWDRVSPCDLILPWSQGSHNFQYLHCNLIINRVLRFNVGPKSSKKLSDICQNSVRKLSFTKNCQNRVGNASNICQKTGRCKYLSELFQKRFGNA